MAIRQVSPSELRNRFDPNLHPRDPSTGRFITSIGGHRIRAMGDRELVGRIQLRIQELNLPEEQRHMKDQDQVIAELAALENERARRVDGGHAEAINTEEQRGLKYARPLPPEAMQGPFHHVLTGGVDETAVRNLPFDELQRRRENVGHIPYDASDPELNARRALRDVLENEYMRRLGAEERHKLPKPRNMRGRNMEQWRPLDTEGDQRLRVAGRQAVNRVGEKRRKWMERRVASMFQSLPPDHPNRPYWEGWLSGAQAVDAGAVDAPQIKIPEIKKDGPRYHAGQLRAEEYAGQLEAGLRYAELKAKKYEDKKLFGRIDQHVWENKVNYYAGMRDRLRELIDIKARADEREALLRRAKEKGYADGAALKGDNRVEAVQEAILALARDPDERARAYWQAKVYGAGHPWNNVVDPDGDDYQLARELGQKANVDDNFRIDIDYAKGNLIQADKDNDQVRLRWWKGIIDGMHDRLDRGGNAPRALTGDLPNASRQRALAHRVAADSDWLDAVIKKEKIRGMQNVNTVYRGQLANGREVIVKPLAEAHKATMRQGIAAGSDAERERAGWFAGQIFGAKVPHTVIRDVEGSGPAVVQEFATGARVAGWDGLPAGQEPTDTDIHKIGLMDAVILNTDRHGNNYMLRGNPPEVIPIDHGLVFPTTPQSPYNAAVLERASRDNVSQLTDDDRAALDTFMSVDTTRELLKIGIPAEAVAAAQARAEAIKEYGRIPPPEWLGMRGIGHARAFTDTYINAAQRYRARIEGLDVPVAA